MIPLRIILERFKTFQQKQTFDFPQSGFYLIVGKNKVEPELSGNATGKSSLLDGLCWVCYGKTVRGLGAGNVASWNQPGQTKVKYFFENHGNQYTLTRTFKKNSLTLRTNGGERQTVTQADVDAAIGYGYEAFLSTVLMGQFNRFFFDLSPAEKLSVFSEILQLGYWEDAAKRAGTLADAAQEKVDKTKATLERCKTEVGIWREQLTEEKLLSEEFATKQRLGVLKTAKDLDDALFDESRSHSAVLDVSEAERFEADDTLLRAIEKELNDAQRYDRDLKVQEAEVVLRRKKHKQLLDAVDARICPTCGTNLANTKHLEKERAVAGRDLQDALARMHRMTDNVPDFEDIEKRLTAERLKNKHVLEDKEELAKLEYAARSKWNNATQRVERLTEDLARAKKAVNVHEERIAALEDKIDKGKSTITDCEDELINHLERVNGFGFWAREFKNLRLWLVEESLRQLEICTNNSLVQLGLRGWKITFDVEKLTKAGTVSRGFNVLIQSPSSPERVDWRNWSGGETTRLRIAGAIGLAELVRARYRIETPFEVWDEPFSYVASESIDGLLGFFEDRSRDENRTTLLIDHHTKAAGNFTGRYIVERTKDSSKIRKEHDGTCKGTR
jgi:DNA repair exonuclease SbcCD ATPase subunit